MNNLKQLSKCVMNTLNCSWKLINPLLRMLILSINSSTLKINDNIKRACINMAIHIFICSFFISLSSTLSLPLYVSNLCWFLFVCCKINHIVLKYNKYRQRRAKPTTGRCNDWTRSNLSHRLKAQSELIGDYESYAEMT